MNLPHLTAPLRFHRYARYACASVFVLAIVSFFGRLPLGGMQGAGPWTFRPEGFLAMPPLTAAGFLIAACALGLMLRPHPTRLTGRLAIVAAATLLLFAGGALFHQLPPGLGAASVARAAGTALAPISRAALPPMAAAGFIAFAIALLSILRQAGQRQRSVYFVVRTLPLLLSAIPLLLWSGLAASWVYGLSGGQVRAHGGLSAAAVASFIALNGGLLLANAHNGFLFYFMNSGFGGLTARRMFPAVALTPFLIGWLAILAADFEVLDLRTSAAAAMLLTSAVFTLMLGFGARTLLRLERVLSAQKNEKTLAQAEAARLAHYDILTGLPNRTLLRERLSEAVKVAARKQGIGALMVVNLDRFKPINDSYGHVVGDQVLAEAAQRLATAVRATDTVSRQGGDEFLILLTEVSDQEDVAGVARKLIALLELPYAIAGHTLFISGSIGISMFPQDGKDAQPLLDHADAAMYYAKSLGKHQFQFFAPHINEHAMRRSAIEKLVREALSEDGLMLRYQPKIALGDSRLAGLEALVRIKSFDGPELSPAEFIPVAEESGLIVELGKWVLNQACRQNRAWQDAGLKPIPVSVNVSAVQFRDNSFVPCVKEALAESGLDPRWLDLEITETTVAQDFVHSMQVMEDLQALGVSISIDDFGTGSSSLSKLKGFCVDSLKIDRSFIQHLPFDEDDAAITRAIIDMARTMHQKVIAEGVETLEQLAFLKRNGCDEVQGFYFSRPLTPEKLEADYTGRW